jgi:hypothetical protein
MPVSEFEEEIARLRDLGLSGLRARWQSVFRRKAADHLPRHLLFRMIAYRLQAEQLGDLDRDTQPFSLGSQPVPRRETNSPHHGTAVMASSPAPP